MAGERSKIQLGWEEKYIEKVNFWAEVDYLRDQAYAAEAANSFTDDSDQQFAQDQHPQIDVAIGNYASLVGDRTLSASGEGKFQVEAGSFQAANVRTAQVMNGRVIIPDLPSGGGYNKARALAAQNSKAAGFMSISEELYYFPRERADENVFAPDFIPVLILLHSHIKGYFENGRPQVNSAFRWYKIGDTQWSAHEGGFAIDIGMTDKKKKYAIADTAWELGLRAVNVGSTFVHIDAGPDFGGYKYSGVPKYRGPESH